MWCRQKINELHAAYWAGHPTDESHQRRRYVCVWSTDVRLSIYSWTFHAVFDSVDHRLLRRIHRDLDIRVPSSVDCNLFPLTGSGMALSSLRQPAARKAFMKHMLPVANVVAASSSRYRQVKPWLQLRFDYDTTTTRLRRKVDMLIFCPRRIASNGNRRARYVVVGS